MIFTKLKLNYFGRFQNREIELKPGINLIYGENEAGKSTIHTFIRGMLFGIERMRGRGSASKEDTYTRYLPWDYPGAYGGSLDIKVGDMEYRLQRSFHANDKSFTVLNLTTGREVKLKEGSIGELVPGLLESTFKNTISIEQLKAQTDTELAAQVRNYITNLSISKSKEVNVAKAVSYLTDQRKQLEASQNMADIKALQVEIEDGLLKEERMDQLTIQLRELLIREQGLVKQREEVLERVDNEAVKQMEQLPAIIEKYRSYRELLRQDSSLQNQYKELQAKIIVWEKDLTAYEVLKEDTVKLQELQIEITKQNDTDLELQRERERLNKEARKGFICLLPCILVAFLVAAMTHIHPVGMLIAILLMIAGIAGYIVLNRNYSNKKKAFQVQENTVRQNRAELQTQMNQILNRYGVSRAEELSGRKEEAIRNAYALEQAKEQQKELEKRQQELEDSRDLIYEIIMKYIQYFLPEEELTDFTMHKLQEKITERKQETEGRLAEINKQQQEVKLNIEKLRWEIGRLEGNEAALLKNKERYSELEQKQKENAVELESIKLALASIQELSTDIHDSFGQQLNMAVSEVIGEVTGMKYTDLKVDEKLEVKVGWNGNYVILDRLSAGTIDQVYFALRLAVADLLLGKDEVPLLLDDSFALYDEVRVKTALQKLSDRKQVILFTCHGREQKILEELGQSYHSIDLSCK